MTLDKAYIETDCDKIINLINKAQHEIEECYSGAIRDYIHLTHDKDAIELQKEIDEMVRKVAQFRDNVIRQIYG